MQLIKGGSSLNSKLKKLSEKHESISFAVAWASSGTDAFDAIYSGITKIRKAVIGTHFYQTHPDVLDKFVGWDNCHFVMQPKGVFHPKVFLFWSRSDWDLLVGSANLTKGAMTENTELLVHITSTDSSEEFRAEVEQTINSFWLQGEVVDAEKARAYRELWKAQQGALRRISGSYSATAKSKPPVHTEIMTMSWDAFLTRIKEDPFHGFRERCNLLELVRGCFTENNSFADMELGKRKTIAGLPTDWNKYWGWFGSMRGSGYYHQAINDNNKYISLALDEIPLRGIVTRDNYDAYIEVFVRAFPNGGHGVAIASRLLALKRPDQFICLDSKNKTQLCKDFGIKQSGMEYQRYWDDVVCRIMDSVWWNSPKPQRHETEQVWLGRAAMLDAIFYQP
ncbi:phospholipase D family protein [Pseudoalteromonas piscicida]|uniref:phospholipase D family protein n=1 Tax=Pseudoalteromonas piscicida TaxID=43662 RepID=UPI00309DA664